MGIRSNRSSRAIAGVLGTAVAVTAIGGAACAGNAAQPNGSRLPRGSERVKLDPADFSTRIDNPYWPMKPGSRWVSRETDSEGAKQRVVVTVTRKTKVMPNGIRARVVHDAVTERGKPVEITDDYYAQDRAGNIWYLGEFTREYENGKIKSTEGSFEAGKDGAQGGVIMPARPRPGLKYRQEYYKGHAEDRAQIISRRMQAEVPFGHFRRVLMTGETNPLEPKVLEFKFYARGVGPVLSVSVSGGSDREELLSYHPGR
jgi:hypothetical protein